MNFKIVNLNPNDFIKTSFFKVYFILESTTTNSYNLRFRLYDPFFNIMFIPGEFINTFETNINYWVGFDIDSSANMEKPNLKNGFRLVVDDLNTKKIIYDEIHLTHHKSFDIRNNSYDIPSYKPRVWIIGDSNAWSSFGNDDYRPLDIGGHYPIRVSVTSLNINRFVNNDYISFINSLPIMENDVLVFYLGEIDFRYNIHLHSNKKNISIEDATKELMIKYQNSINNIKENFDNEIIIMSPNPPMRDNHLTDYISGDEKSRILCWSIFDEFWKKNSKDNVTYLNWTKKYTNSDKLINTELLHENSHHIKDYEYCIIELSNSLLNLNNKPKKHKDAKSLVDYCLNNDLMNKCIFMQVYEEILTLSYWLEGFKPKNILEIGTMGSSFWLMSKLSTGKKVSIDIEPRDSILHHFMYGEDWKHFVGNSQTTEMFESVKDFCPKFDFIFIDGDHTYDGVKKDFEMYKNLLSPRGVIGFHDIDPNHIFADSYAGQVYKFWQDLNEGTKINLVCTKSSGNVKLNGQHSQGFGGIGLWMP